MNTYKVRVEAAITRTEEDTYMLVVDANSIEEAEDKAHMMLVTKYATSCLRIGLRCQRSMCWLLVLL